jgi:hypothetical protein
MHLLRCARFIYKVAVLIVLIGTREFTLSSVYCHALVNDECNQSLTSSRIDCRSTQLDIESFASLLYNRMISPTMLPTMKFILSSVFVAALFASTAVAQSASSATVTTERKSKADVQATGSNAAPNTRMNGTT